MRVKSIECILIAVVETTDKAVNPVIRKHTEMLSIVMTSTVPNVKLNLLLLVCGTLVVAIKECDREGVSKHALDVGFNHCSLANSRITDHHDI